MSRCLTFCRMLMESDRSPVLDGRRRCRRLILLALFLHLTTTPADERPSHDKLWLTRQPSRSEPAMLWSFAPQTRSQAGTVAGQARSVDQFFAAMAHVEQRIDHLEARLRTLESHGPISPREILVPVPNQPTPSPEQKPPNAIVEHNKLADDQPATTSKSASSVAQVSPAMLVETALPPPIALPSTVLTPAAPPSGMATINPLPIGNLSTINPPPNCCLPVVRSVTNSVTPCGDPASGILISDGSGSCLSTRMPSYCHPYVSPTGSWTGTFGAPFVGTTSSTTLPLTMPPVAGFPVAGLPAPAGFAAPIRSVGSGSAWPTLQNIGCPNGRCPIR